MLNKSTLTLFVTIALAGFTAAYQPHRRNIAPYTTISLGKRDTLTRPDNTFDADKAVLSALKTKSKYEQNLVNFQRNVGEVLPGEVCNILVNPYLVLMYIFLRTQSTLSPMFQVRPGRNMEMVQNS